MKRRIYIKYYGIDNSGQKRIFKFRINKESDAKKYMEKNYIGIAWIEVTLDNVKVKNYRV